MIKITTDIAKKIIAFLSTKPGKHAKRKEILSHIGESKTGGVCPFDGWAKKNLLNLGRTLGYGLKGINYDALSAKVREQKPEKQSKRSHMTAEQEATVAGKLADIVFLSVDHEYTEAQCREALAHSGIQVPASVKLAKILRPRFEAAWSHLALELMDVKEVTVVRDKDVDSFTPVELWGALLRKAPQFVPMVAALYTTIPEAQRAVLPSVENIINKKSKTVHLMVTGLLPSQVQDFLNRPKIQHLVEDGKATLTVVKQDTVRFPTPSSVSHVIMLRLTRHSMWHKMMDVYGNDRVTMVEGMTRMEEEVLAAYNRYKA